MLIHLNTEINVSMAIAGPMGSWIIEKEPTSSVFYMIVMDKASVK